jgi:hypothetical protein
MPLRYLLDEHLRGLLWRHVERHNARGKEPLDVVRVGDSPGLSLGELDPQILAWAEREVRIFISTDRATLAKHLAHHLAQGRHSPEIFLVRSVPMAVVIEFLACAAYASEPAEWADRITFIP